MRSIKQTTQVYTLLVFLFWFANSLPLALLVLLMLQRGLSLLQISVLFGVNALAVVLLEVPTGSLADMLGRKRVTIWAAFLMIVGFGVFLTAFTYPLLLVGSVLYGMSRALNSGALDAWFVDTVQAIDPSIDLQPLFSKAGLATMLGLALGTLLGGIIPESFQYLPLPETAFLTKLSFPLLVSLIVQGIRIILIQALVVENRPMTAQSLQDAVTSLPAFIGKAVQLSRQRALIRWILLAAFGGGFVVVSLENFWQPHFSTLLGGTDSTTAFGIIMAGNFVLGAVGNLLSPILSKPFHKRLGLLAGGVQVFRGMILLLLTFQTNVYPAALFFWLIYLGMGVGDPAVGTMLHGEISSQLRSTMLSIQSMVIYIGVFAGSILLGAAAEQLSIRAAWIIGSAVLFALLYPFLKIDRLYRPITITEQEQANVPIQTH